MDRIAKIRMAQDLLHEFAGLTGLDPAGDPPKRYLWTDAFAVCTYLGLFKTTGDPVFRERALRLAGQVHHTLGMYRPGEIRTGWISGLLPAEGERHPTAGGLRIGKILPERGADEPYDERLEWDRDGQYFHYLTRWMHALSRITSVTGDPDYLRWAIELAGRAHARFTYHPPGNHKKRMYWKMSVDLSRPLVPSMGQHDPLDGFVTYSELRLAALRTPGIVSGKDLENGITDMTEICRGMGMVSDDPLGIGGLLSDASWIGRLAARGGPAYPGLLETLLGSALAGLRAFAGSGALLTPARYRLAFRELGLSIGLTGMVNLQEYIRKHPGAYRNHGTLFRLTDEIMKYLPIREMIETFWLDKNSRMTAPWWEHREINMVMLATSLAPEGYDGL